MFTQAIGAITIRGGPGPGLQEVDHTGDRTVDQEVEVVLAQGHALQ